MKDKFKTFIIFLIYIWILHSSLEILIQLLGYFIQRKIKILFTKYYSQFLYKKEKKYKVFFFLDNFRNGNGRACLFHGPTILKKSTHTLPQYLVKMCGQDSSITHLSIGYPQVNYLLKTCKKKKKKIFIEFLK